MYKVLVLLLVLAGCCPCGGFGGYAEVRTSQSRYGVTEDAAEIEFNQEISDGWQVFCGTTVTDGDYTNVVGIRYTW